jgi:hypothetical protein
MCRCRLAQHFKGQPPQTLASASPLVIKRFTECGSSRRASEVTEISSVASTTDSTHYRRSGTRDRIQQPIVFFHRAQPKCAD